MHFLEERHQAGGHLSLPVPTNLSSNNECLGESSGTYSNPMLMVARGSKATNYMLELILS